MLDRRSNRQHLAKTCEATYRNRMRPVALAERACGHRRAALVGEGESETEDWSMRSLCRDNSRSYLGRSVRSVPGSK